MRKTVTRGKPEESGELSGGAASWRCQLGGTELAGALELGPKKKRRCCPRRRG
jgi:hypothetical protein